MKRYLLLLLAMLTVGCELPDTTTDTGSGSDDGDSSGSSSDSAWNNIQWHGDAAAGTDVVMTLSASISGGQVHFTYSSWPWGGSMGLGHFFWWTGSRWQGGKFEWIRAGGQSVKNLTNITSGYNGLSAPASGTSVAFAWTSADGDERSNLATTTWP